MKDWRLEALAKVLVNYSTNVKEGDKVAISGEVIATPFIKEVALEVTKNGGIIEYFVDIPEIDRDILTNGSKNQYAKPNDRFLKCAESDVWLSSWGSNNVKEFQSVDGEKLKERRLANKENRKVYSKRVGDGSLRWCGTQVPTVSDAQNANMSLDEYEEFVYRAGYLYEDDPVAKWKSIEEEQNKWVDYLNTKKTIHFVTVDTDITVNVEGRKWINCCGKSNFPDGEIFTSPVEDSINGKITFSYPSIMNGHEFEKVSLTVEKGRIIDVDCENKSEKDRLLSYIDTDEGSRYFGEVAIGTNYEIKKHTKNILFDEKIGGSIHFAVGDGFIEAGGKNESAIHWDMITDMTICGEIYADGELFYSKGKFIQNIL